MSYSSSVTTVLQKCPEFTHFNLIATGKLSWVVLFTVTSTVTHRPNELYQWSNAMHYSLASYYNFASFRSCDFYRDKRWQNNKRVYKDFFVNVVNVYHIYDWVFQWKNLENWSITGEDLHKSKVARFFGPRCKYERWRWNRETWQCGTRSQAWTVRDLTTRRQICT